MIRYLFAVLLTVILLPKSEAQTKVIAANEHGFIVENVMAVKASPTKVWHAMVTDIDKWWPKDHSWWGEMGTFTLDPVAGGCFCEINGNKSAQHMRIVFVEPEKLLRMTGGLGPLQQMGVFGALDWSLSKTPEGTAIVLTYRVQGFSPEGFEQLAPIVANVQKIQLLGLVNFVESG